MAVVVNKDWGTFHLVSSVFMRHTLEALEREELGLPSQLVRRLQGAVNPMSGDIILNYAYLC